MDVHHFRTDEDTALKTCYQYLLQWYDVPDKLYDILQTGSKVISGLHTDRGTDSMVASYASLSSIKETCKNIF
jgi:hypothetical protein